MFSAYLQAQTDTNKTDNSRDSISFFYKLKPFVVSEFHTPRNYSDNTRTLQLLRQTDIMQLPSYSVADIISNLSTVDIRHRGVGDVQSDVNIRGGSFEQTLILLNGLPVNDPQSGHHNLDLPITKYDIKRIEMLYGPGAELYGPNSFNGAINIITYGGEINGFFSKFFTEGGSYNSYLLGAKAGYNNNGSGISLSVSKEGSDGYRYNTDYRIYNALLQPSIKTGKNYKLYLLAGYKKKNFGANQFYGYGFPDMYEETESFLSGMQYVGGANIKYSPSVFYKYHYDYFLLKRFDPDFYNNKHLTQVLDLDLPFYVTSPIGKTSFGGGYKIESIVSNRLGPLSNETYFIKGDSVNRFDSRQNSFFFLNQELNFDRFYANVGFFVNASNEYRTSFYPEINLSYRIFNGVKLFASYTTSFRVPSFTELYYVSPTVIGNKELKPEKAMTTEIGINSTGSIWEVKGSFFYRKSDNLIDLVKYNNNDTLYFINSPSFYTSGINAFVNIDMQTLFDSKFAINSLNISYEYILKRYKPNYFSVYIDNYLRHKIVSNITLSYANVWFFNINMVSKLRNGSYFDENMEYKNFTSINLINIKLSYTRGKFSVFAGVENVGNIKYYDFNWVPMPSRIFRVGATVEFNKLK